MKTPKLNITPAKTYVAFLVLIAAGVILLQGCELNDIVKINTPPGLQGVPKKITVNEGKKIQEQRRLIDKQLDSAISKGELTTNFLGGLIQQYGDSAFPAGGVVGYMGIGLLGLITGKSGQRKEKEASYRKGRKDVMEDVATAGQPQSPQGQGLAFLASLGEMFNQGKGNQDEK